MQTIFFMIAGFISAVCGIKRPKVGLGVGFVALCGFYYLSMPFEIKSLLITLAIGIPVCGVGSFLTAWIFSGFRGGNHNTGPYFTGSIHGSGSSEGGIVHTDEEKRNMNPKFKSK